MLQRVKYFLAAVFVGVFISVAGQEPATGTFFASADSGHAPKSIHASDAVMVNSDVEPDSEAVGEKPVSAKPLSWFRTHHVFDNLEVGATLGSTGLGIELAAPVTRWTRLRVGVSWVPSFKVPMTFDINTYADGLPSNSFLHVQELLYQMTGLEIDKTVKMTGRPQMTDFKLLVDVFPFRNNRKWHFTAGFFLGNRMVAKAYNKYEEKPTLVGLNIYNRAYNYFDNLQSIFDVPLGGGAYMDPDQVEKLQAKFREYGEMGIYIGDWKATGERYIMEPATDGSVWAKAYVKRFKPYLGFGYSDDLDSTGRWQIGFEAGVLFWGGIADVINQEGVNMTKELVKVRGKVGDYVRVFRALPVYPVIELKISYSIF